MIAQQRERELISRYLDGAVTDEERRMAERFGDDYLRWAEQRGAFLPGSPVQRAFEATLGRLRPRALGWGVAYAICVALAFSAGFVLRGYTRSSVATLERPDHGTLIVSTWPKPEAWMATVFDIAVRDQRVRQRLGQRAADGPIVATILPPRYGMKGMYYAPAPGQAVKAHARGPMMGVDPDRAAEPVEVVFSRATKPYRTSVALGDALDAGVQLVPLVVASVAVADGTVTAVEVPLPQNHWGPGVVMPVF